MQYWSKTISHEPFAKNLSKNVYNSFKLCLPLLHELSRYIFCWIAIFAFMTFAYRYAFYWRLLIFNKFPEQVMFWPFCMQVSNAFCCLNELCLLDVHYHDLLSSFSEKQLKAIAIAQAWKIKTVPCVLNTPEHFVTLPRHLPSWAVQSLSSDYNNGRIQRKHISLLSVGREGGNDHTISFSLKWLSHFPYCGTQSKKTVIVTMIFLKRFEQKIEGIIQ